jgi:predicted dehydrogenase
VQTGFVYGAFSDRHTVEVIGTGGAANLLGYDWAPRGVEVRVAGSPDWQKRCLDSNGYSWETGASYIARCLAIGEAPLMTGEHALHVLEVMVGALQSAASGRRVDVSTTFPWPIVGA